MVPFGSSPKISTPVENTVEKPPVDVNLAHKSLFSAGSVGAKLPRSRFFAAFPGKWTDTSR
jgi:hypothetical protein